MGNTALTPNAKAAVPSGKSTVPGAAVGAEVHTITTAELAAHGHTASSVVSDPGHTHTIAGNAPATAAAGVIAAGAGPLQTAPAVTGITVATTVNSNGSGEAHNNLPPAILGTWFIKL
jgi:microcystin-dependent protein